MAQRARFLAPLALAALSAVAALSLGRVVDSSRFVLPVLGAALLPHLIGAVFRRRNWSVWIGVAATLVGLAVYIVLALEPSTTTLGLPGADTWHALDQQLTNGWQLLRTAPAPAPATDGAILLAVVAVWCMASIADWAAFRRQAALGAISPALVFFVWTSTLGTSDSRVLVTAAFCVAAGAFLLAQNLAVLDRRRNWLVSQHAAHPHWLIPASALGVGAIVFALLLAPIIPGAGSAPLLDVGNAGRDDGAGRSYRPALAPFIDIGDKLTQPADTELFTVKSTIPDYWRIAALDQYSGDDGGRWTLSAEGDGSVGVGLPSDTPKGTLRQEFRIGPLSERWLPAAYRPVAIDLADTLVVRSSGTIVTDQSSVTDLRYTVASALPPLAGSVSPAEQAATKAPLPADMRQYLDLPPGDDMDQIAAIAAKVVEGTSATTPYEKAEALRDYFRGPDFVYDTNVDSDDNGSAILDFLENKHGFCVQFASAYAVMARSLGIPARVAVGFTPGTRDDQGVFHVSSHDAHAWPEIYLAGLGWTHLFDPTPAAGGGAAGGSHLPNDTAAVSATPTTPDQTTPTVPPPSTTPTPGGTNGGNPGTTPVTPTVRPAVSADSTGGDSGPWLLVVGVILLVLVVIGAYVGTVLTAKRRRRARRRDTPDPAAAVIGAWEEALDRLHEASVTPDPALTPRELARAAPSDTNVAAEAPLRRLARTYTAARYGDAATGPDDARDAWTSVDELERALDRDLSWRERWRRRLDPSTLARR
jgi:transglutaminase-like putative cysteine protease